MRRAALAAMIGGLALAGSPTVRAEASRSTAPPLSEAEARYEDLLETFRAAHAALAEDPAADAVVRIEAETMAEIAEELLQEADVDLAIEMLGAALAVIRPDPE